jgi:hypothetical protein
MMKTTLLLLAATVGALVIASCTAYVDPDGSMTAPRSATTTETTTVKDNPYVLGDRTTTERTTTTYR